MTVLTVAVDQHWPDGEVPYEIPGVWAANDRLLKTVDDVVGYMNCVLRGHVTIRSRRPGDRDYLVLRATTRVPSSNDAGLGRARGRQNLTCELRSLGDNPTPVAGSVVRELCRALGVQADTMSSSQCVLSPCVIDNLKRRYPQHG